MRWACRVAAAAIGAAACHRQANPPDIPPYTLVQRWPHDTGAYTQGLVYANGALYESTGRYGQSEVRRVDRRTGRVLASTPLAADRFGEGLALLGGRLYQLTWKSNVGYVYDAATLARVDSFRYAGEGWGLATDGAALIMSDGSATLRVLDPATYRVLREVTVRDDSVPIRHLNELEYVGGEIYANIYGSDWIAAIDPASGQVRGWIDLAALFPLKQRLAGSMGPLNGLAFDERTGHFLITGKLWPALYEIRLPVTRPGTAPPPADTATPPAPATAGAPGAAAPGRPR